MSTYSKAYNLRFSAPWGEIIVASMVCLALVINIALLFAAMWHSDRIVAIVGKNAMGVINKIVMILIAAIAVSLIRQGIVGIVRDMQSVPPTP